MLTFNKEKCTACGACVQACPQSSISLQPDENGFLYPSLFSAACFDCNACSFVCPITKQRPEKSFQQKAYAAIHNDKSEVMRGTSGGAFGAIAEHVLKKNGVVYGCAYEEGLQAAHIRVDDFNALSRLNGSKYVQSHTKMTFSSARKDLNEGRLVLFSGTPCQIAGLQSFLKRPYDNLITVDLICHGVPSQAFFNAFLDWYQKKHGVVLTDVAFRDKRNNGWGLSGTYTGTDIKTGSAFFKKMNYYESFYYFYFLAGVSYRDSCYTCDYATLNRVGDFTLGDFWGAEGYDLPFSSKEGCSLILANSDKASALLAELNVRSTEVSLEDALRCNEQLRKPSRLPAEREEILRQFRECDAETIQRLFKKNHKRAIRKAKIKYAIPSPLKFFLLKLKYKRLLNKK